MDYIFIKLLNVRISINYYYYLYYYLYYLYLSFSLVSSFLYSHTYNYYFIKLCAIRVRRLCTMARVICRRSNVTTRPSTHNCSRIFLSSSLYRLTSCTRVLDDLFMYSTRYMSSSSLKLSVYSPYV